jgi:hypothetical protein
MIERLGSDVTQIADGCLHHGLIARVAMNVAK